MNQEDYKIAYENVLEANKMLNKTIKELRESVINWDIDYDALSTEEDRQRFQELKDILKIKDNNVMDIIDLSEWSEITYSEDWEMLTKDFNRNCTLFVNKINEIIDKLNEMEKE